MLLFIGTRIRFSANIFENGVAIDPTSINIGRLERT